MQSTDNVDAPSDWNSLWRGVSENLLGGLHHALNNRVAALSAISQVLGSGMPDAAPLVASLASEVDRLEETVALISLIRRARSHHSEPIQLPELAATLPPLLAQHPNLKEVVFVTDPDPGVLPVFAERDLLTHVLLTLLASVGIDAERSGRRRVRVSFSGDEATVAIRVSSEPEPSRSGDGGMLRRLDARAAGDAVTRMKGSLQATSESGGPVSYELRLPSLLAARRQE